jgi:uncharacterized protein YaaN involved in tellurite resistance
LREHYLQVAKDLAVGDMASVSTYGTELNGLIKNNGQTLLDSTRMSEQQHIEVVALIDELGQELGMIDLDDAEGKNRWKNIIRQIPLLGSLVKKTQNIFKQYDSINERITEITNKISQAKMIAKRDSSVLETMYNNNVQYIAQLQDMVMGAKVKLEEIDTEIAQMKEDPSIQPHELNDINNFRAALVKRIADMEISENVMTQALFEIRTIQNNNDMLSNNAENICDNVIPLWKTQIANAVAIHDQEMQIQAQQKVADMTNQMLITNAKRNHQNSVAIAKASSETVIKLDTLKQTTQELINMVNDVEKIRIESEKALGEVEQNLKTLNTNLDKTILRLE